MSFTCPYAKVLKGERYFSCTKAMQEGVDYNIHENRMSVFCASQYWCNECGTVKNSPSAQKCYEYHSRN